MVARLLGEGGDNELRPQTRAARDAGTWTDKAAEMGGPLCRGSRWVLVGLWVIY